VLALKNKDRYTDSQIYRQGMLYRYRYRIKDSQIHRQSVLYAYIGAETKMDRYRRRYVHTRIHRYRHLELDGWVPRLSLGVYEFFVSFAFLTLFIHT
jgi:hypothetical protein